MVEEEEEEIKFTEYQINIMKKIIRKKILYMEDAIKFLIFLIFNSQRERRFIKTYFQVREKFKG